MDVERIQKINNLALNLMKQGLASTRDEAIEQAQRIFKDQEGTQEYNEIVDQVKSMKESRAQDEPSQEPASETQATPAPTLSQDKIEEILRKNTDYLVKTIKAFQEEIAGLKQEMAQLRSQRASMPALREVVQEPQQPQAQTAQQAPAQEESNGSHPRSGNYNDNDVSIEKFFYMGSK